MIRRPRKGWRQDGGMAKKCVCHCREEVRVSAAERTRADSHYTRIPAVISGRRISRIRRRRVVVIDPRSLFFSTRVPSFGSRLIRLSYRSTILLIPSPYTKEFIHSLTPWLSPSKDSLIFCHCECHRALAFANFRGWSREYWPIRQNRSIDRSCCLDWRFPVSLSLSLSLSLSQSRDYSRLRRRDTNDTRYYSWQSTTRGGCARGKLGAKCQKSRRLK